MEISLAALNNITEEERKRLKELLKKGAIARREENLEMAREWFVIGSEWEL